MHALILGNKAFRIPFINKLEVLFADGWHKINGIGRGFQHVLEGVLEVLHHSLSLLPLNNMVIKAEI